MTLISRPRVAVLLATYNGLEWLPEQIETIASQQNVTIDLFISDDGSSDGTKEWLKNHQQPLNLKLLPDMRSGSAAANFFRLLRDTTLADYDYVALSDQDDRWYPDKLMHAINVMHDGSFDAYSGNVMAYWTDGRRKLIEKSQPQTKYDYLFESSGPGCTFVLSKKISLDLQQFLIEHKDECAHIYYHDWFIYAFARTKQYRWIIDSLYKMDYRQHGDNLIGVNTGIHAYLVRWSKLRSGQFLAQSILTAKILSYPSRALHERMLRLNIFDRLLLASQSAQFRRRLRDRLGLAITFLVLSRKMLSLRLQELGMTTP